MAEFRDAWIPVGRGCDWAGHLLAAETTFRPPELGIEPPFAEDGSRMGRGFEAGQEFRFARHSQK
jgi:hypothetical protein